MSRTTAKQTVAPTPEEIGAQPYLGDDRQQPVIIQEIEPPYIEGGIWLKPIPPEDVVLASFGTNVISRSTDAGLTWSSIVVDPSPLISLFSFASVGDTLFVGGVHDLYRSMTKGATWEQITPSTLSTTSNISGMTYSSTALFVMTFDGTLHRSTDGGDTWTFTSANFGLPISRSPSWTLLDSEGDNILAITRTGEGARSSDSGVTWTEIPRNLGLGAVVNVESLSFISPGRAIVGAGFDQSFITYNGGGSWFGDAIRYPGSRPRRTLALGAGPGLIFAGSNDGRLSVSRNFSSWSTVNPLGLNSGSEEDVRIIRVAGDIVLVGFRGGNYSRSDDRGVTWVGLPQNLGLDRFSDAFQFHDIL